MRRRVKTTRSVSDTLVRSFGALVLSIPLWSLFYAPSAVSTTFIRGPTRRSFGFLGHRQITHGPCLQGRTREHSREHSSIARSAVFSVIAEEVNNRPGFFFGEVLIIVVLSAGFEKAERWLRKKLKASGDFTGGEILDALFREITILGFIGLLLFVLTHLLPEDSPLISLGADEYNILPETFEYVHMATFLLLVVLLFQGFAVLRISRETAETWADYESTRAFGTNPLSMESLLISEGYLERRVSSESPAPDSNLALDESKMELRMLKPFTYGGTVIERASLRRKYIHKLIMWRAVRHGFLFEGAQSKLLSSEGVIPGLFSFEVFLEQQLSQIVLSLVEVDVLTWFYALLLVALVTLICLSLESVNGQAMQCICCWALAAVAFAFSIILEEDTYELTLQVPVDPRQILRMFSGTSIQMIRRASFLDISQEVAGEISRSGRRFRPQLPGVEGSDLPRTQEPSEKSAPGTFLLVPEYTGVFKLLCFLQAAVVASLLVNLLNGSVYGWDRVVPYLLAWAEWPLMLFVLVPDLVRRLTVRAAVTRTRTNNWFHDKQRGLVKRVMISGIEGLLRDCTRLIHLQGMEARAVMNGETWAQNKASAQAMTGQFAESLKKNAVATAKKNVKRGAEFFDQLQPALKTEVFSVFSSWDARNAGAVAPFELVKNMELMGFMATADRVADNLIRLVDDDGSGLLTWRKCRSLFMLATAARPMDERRRDLEAFFSRINKGSPRFATVFEIAKALPFQIRDEDLATLMYVYFGRVKPSVSRSEFVEWIEAIEMSEILAKRER